MTLVAMVLFVLNASAALSKPTLIPYSDFKLLTNENRTIYIQSVQDIVWTIETNPKLTRVSRIELVLPRALAADGDPCFTNGFAGRKNGDKCDVKTTYSPGFIASADLNGCPIDRACGPMGFGYDNSGHVFCFKSSVPANYDSMPFQERFKTAHAACQKLKTVKAAEMAAIKLAKNQAMYNEMSTAIGAICSEKKSAECQKVNDLVKKANATAEESIGDTPGKSSGAPLNQ